MANEVTTYNLDSVDSLDSSDFLIVDTTPSGGGTRKITKGNLGITSTSSIVYNALDYGVTGDGTTSDSAAINSLITTVHSAGGGTIQLPVGNIKFTTQVTPKDNVIVRGHGKELTTLTTGVNSGYFFTSTTTLDNFKLEDMTIDAGSVSSFGEVSLYYASNCGIERVYFKNVAASWMLKIGVTDGATEGVLCENNKFIDCDFDTHSGSLEMLLLFNCRNTEVIRPTFRNKTGGPTLGLWQKCYNTKIIKPNFYDLDGGGSLYYSVTVEDTIIDSPYFENTSAGIQGANESDNGLFGLTQAKNLKILNPTFVGGANSEDATAIQLGAVDNAVIMNPSIEEYQIGISVRTGNDAATASATNWKIIGGNIKNTNASADFHVLHPGILLSAVGGSLNGFIMGVNFYDDQGTPTQRYPIVFDGAFTWDDITIQNNRLTPYNVGTSIALADGAALGSDVDIQFNTDYTGTNPAQSSGVAGSDTQVQFNDGGSIGGDADFVWDKTNNRLGLGGTPSVQLHMQDATISQLRLEKTGTSSGAASIYNDGLFNIIGKGSSPQRRIIFYDQLMSGSGATNTASNPILGNFNDTDTGIFFPSDTNEIGISTGGTERLRVSNTVITLGVIDIALDTSTGTKLGTATSQKLGVWNATPIVQPTTGISAAAFVANTSLTANDSATYGGYTIGQIVAALKAIGLLA